MAHDYAPHGADIKHKNRSKLSCTTSPALLEASERRAQIMEWRTQKCLSYAELANLAHREIGTENLPKGYDRRYAWRDVTHCLQEFKDKYLLDAATFVSEEVLRLDDMFYRVRKRAFPEGSDSVNVDLSAVNVLIRIMERRAKMLGLDEARKLQVTHRLMDEASEQERLAALRGIMGKLSERSGEDALMVLKQLTVQETIDVEAVEVETRTGSERG